MSNDTSFAESPYNKLARYRHRSGNRLFRYEGGITLRYR